MIQQQYQQMFDVQNDNMEGHEEGLEAHEEGLEGTEGSPEKTLQKTNPNPNLMNENRQSFNELSQIKPAVTKEVKNDKDVQRDQVFSASKKIYFLENAKL